MEKILKILPVLVGMAIFMGSCESKKNEPDEPTKEEPVFAHYRLKSISSINSGYGGVLQYQDGKLVRIFHNDENIAAINEKPINIKGTVYDVEIGPLIDPLWFDSTRYWYLRLNDQGHAVSAIHGYFSSGSDFVNPNGIKGDFTPYHIYTFGYNDQHQLNYVKVIYKHPGDNLRKHSNTIVVKIAYDGNNPSRIEATSQQAKNTHYVDFYYDRGNGEDPVKNISGMIYPAVSFLLQGEAFDDEVVCPPGFIPDNKNWGKKFEFDKLEEIGLLGYLGVAPENLCTIARISEDERTLEFKSFIWTLDERGYPLKIQEEISPFHTYSEFTWEGFD